MAASGRARRWAGRLVVAAACALPLAKVGFDFVRDGLGANPIETALNRLGFWTLVLLLTSLVPSALQIVSGWAGLIPHRRLIGLFAFFYATLHLATYVGLDQFFDGAAILEDVVKRKFITVGFVAFLLLVPLAVTSNGLAVRRLGFERWKLIHRLTYVAAILGVVHFVWRVKADLQRPLLFAAVLVVLLGVRVVDSWRRRRPAEEVE
jgi:methionine sulfoxide reductase heme-binding subunit